MKDADRRDLVAAVAGAGLGMVGLGLLAGEATALLGIVRLLALVVLHFIAGVFVGALAGRRWWVSGVVAWGAASAALLALFRGPGLTAPVWTQTMVVALLLVAAALAGGAAADRFWRRASAP